MLPTVHRPTRLLLRVRAHVKLIPTAEVYASCRMVKQLARSINAVATFLERDLQRTVFGVIVKVNVIAIAAGCRGVATSKNCRSRGSAIDSCRVSVGKRNAHLSETVQVRRLGHGRTEGLRPIIHVVHREENDIGFRCKKSRCSKDEQGKGKED